VIIKIQNQVACDYVITELYQQKRMQNIFLPLGGRQKIGTDNMMRLKITVGVAALALATAFASAPAFAAQHHHRHQVRAKPLYNYSAGYVDGRGYNDSGYVSGQPGPSSSLEAIR
jgi:hypothetical protein